MDSVVYEAFWSYAHEDNDRQRGRVLALSEALQDEYAVTTGDDLTIFVDRDDIKWGEVWRERIDRALGEAPFFIAVITPKYVKSAECRKELLAFSREVTSRGIDRLLLPILFINVPELDEDSGDEVLSIIARTQYVDWTRFRLKDPNSTEVLEAVEALASRLSALRKEASLAEKSQETRTDAENFDSLNDIVEAINGKLSPWLEAVEFDLMAGKLWAVTVEERLARIGRLRAGRQSAGAVLSVFKTLGLELLPIAKDRREKSKAYSRTTSELAPLVTAALRYIRHHPEFLSSLDPLADGVREAMLNIEPTDDQNFSYGLPKNILGYSKSLAETDQALSDSMLYIGEANDIVREWSEELNALEAGEASVVDAVGDLPFNLPGTVA